MLKREKHPHPKKKSPSGHKGKLVLEVEVLQRGEIQVTRKWKVSRLLPKRVGLGSSRRDGLYIPLASFPAKIPIFRVGNGKVKVSLDPRIKGMLYDGSKGGDVRTFTAPEKALIELSSIEEPLEVPLRKGAYGSLELYGFEIIFKVHVPLHKRKGGLVVGAPRGFFALPAMDSPLEKWALPSAMASALLVGIPLLLWLLKAPRFEIREITDLPAKDAIELLHPSHFQFLPLVFEDEFANEDLINQAIFYVSELQRRWKAQEVGKHYVSTLPFLGSFTQEEQLPSKVVERWKVRLDEFYANLEKQRTDPKSPRYFKMLKAYPRLVTEVSGGTQGSLWLRQKRRIEMLQSMQSVLKEMVESKDSYLREHYGSLEVTLSGGRREGFEADVPFSRALDKERENYETAQEFVDSAQSFGRFRELLQNLSQSSRSVPSVVWLGGRTPLVPHIMEHFLKPGINDREAILTNARYSNGLLAIPPAPTPKPSLNSTDLDLFIYGKREELKACYESALRRTPSLTGVVRWKWTIDLFGKARKAVITGTEIKDRDFLFCLRTRIEAWRFPRPRNGAVTVTYPLRFVVNLESPSLFK
jgi:hypothetical protein